MDIDSDLRERVDNLESIELNNGRMKHETIEFETEEEIDPHDMNEILEDSNYSPIDTPLDGILRSTLYNWDDSTRLWIRAGGNTLRLAHDNKFPDDPRATTEQFLDLIRTLQKEYTLTIVEKDD